MSWRFGIGVLVLLAGALSLIPQRRSARELRPFETVVSSIARGEVQRYYIRLDRNQYARVGVTQQDIDLEIRATESDDKVQASANGSAWGREELSISDERGGVYRLEVVASQVDTARGSYRISIEEIRPSKPADRLESEAQTLFAWAKTLDSLDRSAARSMYARSATLWHKAGLPLREAQALLALGRSHDRTGSYAVADQIYRQSIRLFELAKDEAGRLDAEKAWANLGGHLGEVRGGPTFLRRQLQAWLQLRDRRGVARFLSSIATEHAKAHRYSDAIDYEGRALVLRRELRVDGDIAGSSQKLAGYYYAAKNLALAITYATEALAISRRMKDVRSEAAYLGTLCGLYFDAGSSAAYLRSCQQSRRRVHKRLGDKSSEANAVQWLSRIEDMQGRYREAILHADEAIELEEELRSRVTHPIWRIGFRSGESTYPYKLHSLMNAHASNRAAGYDREAFGIVDRLRAGRFRTNTPSFAEIQRAIGTNEVGLSFYLEADCAKDRVIVWFAERDRFITREVQHAKRIRGLAGNLQEHLAAPSFHISGESHAQRLDRLRRSRAAMTSLAADLGHALFQGLPRLAKRILITPDERFASIPFAILPDPDPDHAGQFLIENHEVIYVPSMSAVIESRKSLAAPKAQRRLLAVLSYGAQRHRARHTALGPAAADFRGEPSPLPFASQDTAAIASLLPIGSVTEVAATTDAFASRAVNGHRILHIATHAIVEPEKPELSRLMLAPSGDGSGVNGHFLTVTDILKLRTDADLVTLAACETARGREVPARGVISLTSAFLSAGASQVVATNWKVDDEASSALMQRFYRALLHEGLTAPAALREAQLALLRSERWKSSYYWGGFGVYGDAREIRFAMPSKEDKNGR